MFNGCVLFKVFGMKPQFQHSCHECQFPNNVTDSHEWIMLQYCHASQCVIGQTMGLLSIEHPDWSKSSCVPALWHHDWIVSMVFFQGWLVGLKRYTQTMMRYTIWRTRYDMFLDTLAILSWEAEACDPGLRSEALHSTYYNCLHNNDA